MNDDRISLPEAAAWLRMSAKALGYHATLGNVAAVKDGRGEWSFWRGDLQRWRSGW